jgi:hypothetical protein
MRALVPVVALLVALAGCGGDTVDEPPPEEPPTSLTPSTTEESKTAEPSESVEPTQEVNTVAARKAFRAWFDAYATGDGDRACALQTRRFTRSQLARAVERDALEPGASCGTVVAVAGVLFETFQIGPADAEISEVSASAKRVGFTVSVPDFPPLGYAMLRTADGWRIDQDLTAN